MNENFEIFRDKYKSFSYNGYSIEQKDDEILISFDFSIDGLCEFHPQTRIKTDNLQIINTFNSKAAENIVFSLGMVEAVSYWKCACPASFIVRCASLSESDKNWWKKLWFNGLSEMFYRNGIETNFNDFVKIECPDSVTGVASKTEFNLSGTNIVPIGGGKDSVVSLEMLKELRPIIKGFTVNDQPARTQCAVLAGLCENDVIKTYRTIDKELLNRNAEGFLNGHTPFSAIVAFLSLYCAYLIGAENIILSNESSANDSNICGTEINHQYSKSYEFEKDFNDYVKNHFGMTTHYFSILRPFNELQIAKQFAAHKKYHSVFKSCNAGSKKNIWCGHCSKCLFVYIILSPFLSKNELDKIFPNDMLNMENMLDDFCGLAGFSRVKPFECIGTVSEVCCALELTLKKYKSENLQLPALLEYYKKNRSAASEADGLLNEFNSDNNIPQEFLKYVWGMFKYVSVCS